MKFSPIFIMLLMIVSCQTENPGKSKQNSQAKEENINAKMDSIIDNSGFNGVVLLTKDSTTIYKRAIGYTDLESKELLTTNNQFVIGSISKQITAVLVLRSYEKGELSLDDTLSKYLPEIDQPWSNEVSVHHLLTHTHGIVSTDESLEFEPGAQFHYSQLGYDLLAQILEKVKGKSFNELSTELFAQFGLSNTFHPDNKSYKNLVKGYEELESGELEYAVNSLDNYVAAGSFISTVEDLNKWNELLYSGELVEEETLQLMKTRFATRTHPIFDTVEYGYGLLFKDGESDIQIGALGYAPGFVSACYHYPKANMNLIVLENTARNLHDFRLTFEVHTRLMKLTKDESLTLEHN